ncbi:MAG TPA: multiheme c-type cytochrome [Terriglobia bacterium]|nr:multiheme c-type cytochrome [Terriglobia bacterium]
MSRTFKLAGILTIMLLNVPLLASALTELATRAATGDLRCARCHPAETAGYLETQMAHSSSGITCEPPGAFSHAVSNARFSVELTGSKQGLKMVQRLERDGFSGSYEPAYAIGSGSHAVAYLVETGGHLFQSPICFYAGRGWDMAPGYEKNPQPDFQRPVTADCLFCHVGKAQPVGGSLNRYRDPPITVEGITCERCHGPAEAHLRNPVPGSIVNPAKLPARARDSVCEQCHLSGEARITNPGRQLSDFQPPQDLEDVFSVYVFASSRDPSQPDALRVISQAQQLALSTCFRRSNGKLWCGTCHDPHRQPTDAKAWFRARCLGCHGDGLLRTHPKPNDDCIGCHMPHRPVSDGGHTVFTDHRIARRPLPETAAGAAPAVNSGGGPRVGDKQTLVAWHSPSTSALEQRNLGLAEVEVGERIKSVSMVSSGARRLTECWSKFPNDAPVLTAIGQVMLGAGDARNAASVFERAIQAQPDNPSNYIHAALAWKAAGDSQKAIERLEKALRLDPVMEQPYRVLAEVYGDENQPAMVHMTYERYLKAFPESIEAQQDVKDSAMR